jgi:hypothetical protein
MDHACALGQRVQLAPPLRVCSLLKRESALMPRHVTDRAFGFRAMRNDH